MPRPHPLTATMTSLLLAVTLAAASRPGPEASSSGPWGSSLAMRDPDPGYWRAQPGELTAGTRPYSAGMSSLAAVTPIRAAASPHPQPPLPAPTGEGAFPPEHRTGGVRPESV